MYLEYFGLARHPFQITPDVQFFFDSRVHKRALATITYGLSKKEGFVVVTGEVGAGKTTLIEYLLASGNLDSVVTARISTTQLEADNLLELLVGELGLRKSGASKAAFLRDLSSFFLRTTQRGRSVLLIVDEVQNLSPGALEELRMLSNFQNREQPMVQMLLVGQPEFRARLASRDCEQIRQRVITSYHLSPLAAAEVPVYVEHRLHQAGWSGDSLFDTAVCAGIHRETGGVPRKINRLCDRLMLYAFLEERRHIDEAALKEVIAEMRAENLSESHDERSVPDSVPVTPTASPVPAAPAPPAIVPPSPKAAATEQPAPGRNGGPASADDYSELLATFDDLRRSLGAYRTKMEEVLRLVSENERRRRKGP